MTQLDRIEEKLDKLLALLEGGAGQAHGLSPALPTFGGYNCSWTVDREGFPSYIIDPATGEMAHRHSKQDDIWWSCKDESAPGGYRRILGFTAVELAAGLPGAVSFRLPDEAGPLMSDEADARGQAREAAADRLVSPPQDHAPFEDASDALHRLHKIGRQAHGEEWRKVGPEMVQAYTDGRTDSSFDMNPGEVATLMAALQEMIHS